MRSSWLLAVIVALWITGCAEDVYVYRPAEQATATINGLPAGRYAIPPERPVGTVWVASSGTTKVTLASGVTTRMLSVRLVVANNDGESNWVVDTREQRMIVRGLGESRPAFVNTERQDPPLVTIERGQKRTLDLLYPLPEASQKKGPVEFDLAWQVRTGERLIAERTPFDRLELEPVYYDGYVGSAWGWGPYWWYDQFWPGPGYLASPGFIFFNGPPTSVAPAVPMHRPEGPARVGPPPMMEPPRTAPPMGAPGVPIHR